MKEEALSLLFIGRDAGAERAWPEVRRIWRTGKARRVGQAYQGLALMLKDVRIGTVLVDVDHLSADELSFFSTASRYRPGVRLLAFGEGDKLSNSRLGEASRHGATEIIDFQKLSERLVQLLAQEHPECQAPGTGPVARQEVGRDIGSVVEESTGPSSIEQAKPKEPENFLAARNVRKGRRKAPAAGEPEEKRLRTQDVVTPEELRVLLGEDDEEPNDERGQK